MSAQSDQINSILGTIKTNKNLLDSGAIDIGEYLKRVNPLLNQGSQLSMQIGQSKGGGTLANQYMQALQNQSGLMQDMSKPGVINFTTANTDLGQKYQQQIRESLLPDNLTAEQKQTFISQIPNDVQYGTDQYNILREGLNQQLQSQNQATADKTARAGMLSSLGDLLNQQVATQFDRNKPAITEAANTGGILRGTGFGEALARYQSQLSTDASQQLAKAGIDYGNQDISNQDAITQNLQAFQTSALNRNLSLEDYNKQVSDAMKLALATKPSTPNTKASNNTALAGSALEAGATAATKK